MKNRFLIIPGFAKGGTTFLYDQMASHAGLFNLPISKELGAFRTATPRSKYLEMFTTHDPQKVFIDASPMYVEPWFSALENAARALHEDDVRLIVCMRSPIARAFSHYTHEIRGGFWVFAFDGYPLHDPRILSRYLHRQRPVMEKARRLFGDGAVSGYTIDYPNAPVHPEVLQFVGLPDNWQPSATGERFSAGWLPRVYYDSKRPIVVESLGQLYEIPPRMLVVSSGPFSELRYDLAPEIGNRLVANSAQWSRTFDPASLGNVFDEIENDYLTSCEILGLSEMPRLSRKTYTAPEPPPLPQGVTQYLQHVGSLSDVLDEDYGYGRQAMPTFERPSLPKLSAEIEQLYMQLYVASPPEFIPLRSQIAQLREQALRAFGCIPDYATDFLLQCLILGQGERALNILIDMPEILTVLDRPRFAEKLEYFRPNIDGSSYTALKTLIEPSPEAV